jgi:hypothetical protein
MTRDQSGALLHPSSNLIGGHSIGGLERQSRRVNQHHFKEHIQIRRNRDFLRTRLRLVITARRLPCRALPDWFEVVPGPDDG